METCNSFVFSFAKFLKMLVKSVLDWDGNLACDFSQASVCTLDNTSSGGGVGLSPNIIHRVGCIILRCFEGCSGYCSLSFQWYICKKHLTVIVRVTGMYVG